MILQAGVSPEGRDFAARHSDAIFSPFGKLPEAADFYRDVKARAARFGRNPDDLKVLPSASFVLGDTPAEAQERHRQVREEQITGRTAQILLEQVWNRDLSGYDPDGPLPDVDPVVGGSHVAQGRAQVRMYRDPLATARQWRELAAEKGYSIRELMIEVQSRQSFVGSPQTVAAEIDDLVQSDASDGFILVPHLVPGGLDPFVDSVVPLLQERGVFRADYEGTTLREHLGLAPLS